MTNPKGQKPTHTLTCTRVCTHIHLRDIGTTMCCLTVSCAKSNRLDLVWILSYIHVLSPSRSVSSVQSPYSPDVLKNLCVFICKIV